MALKTEYYATTKNYSNKNTQQHGNDFGVRVHSF